MMKANLRTAVFNLLACSVLLGLAGCKKEKSPLNKPEIKDALPPVDRSRGGFWSLTMYDQDYFMLPDSPNGRTNIGTVNLDADELRFSKDGSLTITLSASQPQQPDALANWLPAPQGQFALIVRTYVPGKQILEGEYKLPNVHKEKK